LESNSFQTYYSKESSTQQPFLKVGGKKSSRAWLTLLFLAFVYIGTYHLFVIPSERKQSFQPVFEVVSSQQTNGPVYLVNPSEVLRGASFFYLGKRIPVLDAQDLLLGRVGDQPGTTFVIYAYCDNNPLLSHLRSKGYRPLLQKKFGKTKACVYSNAPETAAINETSGTRSLNWVSKI
jgi:hypothetical protein